MSNKLIGATMFVIGAAAGSVATYFIMKKKHEQTIQEEVEAAKESVKESFTKYYETVNSKETTEEGEIETENLDIDDSVITEADGIVEKEGYKNDEKKFRKDIYSEPELIAPEDLGETNYSIVCTRYFKLDDILADDYGIKLNIEKTIGRESLNHFGDYEDDCIDVRNHYLELDYEVLLEEERHYSEVFK